MRIRLNLLSLSLLCLIGTTFSQSVLRSTFASGIVRQTSSNYQLEGGLQSVGQHGVIGAYVHGTVTISQGFIQSIGENDPEFILQVIDLDVYPNPFYESINIKLDTYLEDPVQIRITNLLGQTVFNDTFEPTKEIEIPLVLLVRGEYILIISSGQAVSTHNLIKQ